MSVITTTPTPSGPPLPASITITQALASPSVAIGDAASGVAPGLPPYPLNTDPSQTWWLTIVNGQLAWVQTSASPGLTVVSLEDAQGLFLLEDGGGYLLMEP